ncbi:MAG: hypothetical protein U0L09_07150 [Christensenellales bacterium]|nr:hypothetical protein [Christensenellales bacterium]
MENDYLPEISAFFHGVKEKNPLAQTLEIDADSNSADFIDCLKANNFAGSEENPIKIAYEDRKYKVGDWLCATLQVANPYDMYVDIRLEDQYPGSELPSLADGPEPKQSFAFVFKIEIPEDMRYSPSSLHLGTFHVGLHSAHPVLAATIWPKIR